MQVIDSCEKIKLKNTAVTLGKFDGLHLGHQALIHQLKCAGKMHGYQTVLFSFDVVSAMGSGSLNMKNERIALAEQFGIDTVVFYPVTRETMGMEPETFIRKLLVERMDVRHVVTGTDFCFGKNRRGSVEMLKQFSKDYGYSVEVVPDCYFLDEKISSSRIKERLSAGDLEQANQMLGYPYFMKGIIIPGKKIGRTMDIRTLNLRLPKEKILVQGGVYGTTTEIDGVSYRSITNVGICPTVSDVCELSVETHVLDFHREIYGQEVTVFFHQFLRKEQKFDSLIQLREQIQRDIQRRCQMFEKNRCQVLKKQMSDI